MNTQAKNQQIEFEVFPKENKSNYSYLSGVKNENLREGASINVVFSNQSIIIILICVFMSLVASFSLGVEKGKLIVRSSLTDEKPPGTVVSITPQASVIPDGIKIPNQPVPITPASNSNAVNHSGVPNAKQEENQNVLPLVQTTTPIVEVKDNAGPKKGYTIQVATVNTKESAKILCDVLTKKGITAYSRPSGKYMIVLAGDFAKKEEAQPRLRELKKTYTDCFIKKI